MKIGVMFSGGMDSTTALAEALRCSNTVHTFTFNYGSKHWRKEVTAACNVAKYYGDLVSPHANYIPREIFQGAGSTLMGEGEVPNEEYHDPEKESPSSTIVPFRNALLLSAAVARCIAYDCDALYLGVHSTDWLGWAYPDCTPEFTGAMANAIYVGSGRKVRLVTPFQWMTKADIVRRAAEINAPLHLTWSCYRGEVLPCGECPTCNERIGAFTAAGYRDPVKYPFDPFATHDDMLKEFPCSL